jgi:phosphoglycerate dehydrogenase-like enzyme
MNDETGQIVWLDPSWRRMDELFSAADEAALRQSHDVIWGRDDPAPDGMLEDALPRITALVAAEPNVDASLLAAAPKLRMIVEVSGAFPPTIDYAACRERGVEVLSCAPGFRESVAEMAVAMLLASGRGLVEEHERFRSGREHWLADRDTTDFSLFGATVGFVGFGSIAREITRVIAPFRPKVLAYDPFLPSEVAETAGAQLVSLDEVMSHSRAVLVAAVPTHENRGMIGQRELSLMQDNAHLHVISRAHLVDFDALTAEVLSGRIRAAIDVFPSEPVPANHPIRNAPGVILSPHRAAAVPGGRHLIGRMLIDDLAALGEGREGRRLLRATEDLIAAAVGVGDAAQVAEMASRR